MKVAAPYKCDYCGAQKGLTNHWWLRQSIPQRFVLLPWDGDLADREGYEHICSESCASKALSKWMARSVVVEQVTVAQAAVAVTGEPREIPHVEALNTEGRLGCICLQCIQKRHGITDELERQVQEVMP